jgi:ankyrin repeat protein
VQNLLDSGEDVHQRDQIGNTALHQAANQGVVEIGAFLIRYGADVNAVNDDGNTPLDVARSEHNIPFEKLLLAYGARPGTPPEARPVSSPE